MLPNLILNTGANVANVSQQVTSPIVVTNTPTTSNVIINQLTINLTNPKNQVLLSGSIDALISDSAASPASGQILGPVSLEIFKPINGTDTIIYQSTFSLTNMAFSAGISIPYKFAFEWVDSTIASTACPNMCPDTLNNCPVNAITYTFHLAVLSGARTTLSGTIPAGSYYSLSALEIPQ